jgi:hypothetical protein
MVSINARTPQDRQELCRATGDYPRRLTVRWSSVYVLILIVLAFIVAPGLLDGR